MSNEKSRVQAALAIKKFQDNFDVIAFTEMCNMLATQRKIKYDAYIKAGFSNTEALWLCKEP